MAPTPKAKELALEQDETAVREVQTISPWPPILDLKGAMRFTGFKKTFLYRAMDKYGLPYHSCGARRRFVTEELLNWIRAQPAR